MAYKKNFEKKDAYEAIAEYLIQRIESGQAVYKKRWKNVPRAMNYASGHQYTGQNQFILSLSGYELPFFLTFKQAKDLGGNVKKGSKSIPLLRMNPLYFDANGNRVHTREEAKDIRVFPKVFRVFNVEQVEGITWDFEKYGFTGEEEEGSPIEAAEAAIERYLSKENAPAFNRVASDRAYYSPYDHRVVVPKLAQFEQAEEHYSTIMHELIHSTGHESLLSREGIISPTKFGDEKYAAEELVAEIGAAYAMGRLGIEQTRENSAGYLAGWLRVLKNERGRFFKAAREAEKAVELILE